MPLSNTSTRDVRLIFLIFAALIFSSVANAQGDQSVKHAAVVKMLQAADVKSKMAALFKRQIALYDSTFPAASIANFEAKGMFKNMPPDRVAKMKDLINEFGSRLTVELQQKVVDQVVTDQTIETLIAPVYEANFTLDEVRELSSFYENPDGKRLFDMYSDTLAESLIANLQRRGLYQMLPSPDDEVAKLDKIMKAIQDHPADFAREVFDETRKRVADQLTQKDLQVLADFWQTASGRKMARIGLGLTAEMLQRSNGLYASRVGDLTRKTYNEQMVWFDQRTREIFSSKRKTTGN